MEIKTLKARSALPTIVRQKCYTYAKLLNTHIPLRSLWGSFQVNDLYEYLEGEGIEKSTICNRQISLFQANKAGYTVWVKILWVDRTEFHQ